MSSERKGFPVWIWVVLVLGMVALHQDFWLWGDRRMVLGFLPAGLAYHMGYSILACVVMVFLVQFAWPKHLEDLEPHEAEGQDQAR